MTYNKIHATRDTDSFWPMYDVEFIYPDGGVVRQKWQGEIKMEDGSLRFIHMDISSGSGCYGRQVRRSILLSEIGDALIKERWD